MVNELIFVLAVLGQQKITGTALLNPDISLTGDIVNMTTIGDEIKNSFRLREFEIGIQGYIHPHIKVDSFISFHIGEFIFPLDHLHNHNSEHTAGENHKGDAHMHPGVEIEEGYLSFLSVLPGISGKLGRKYVSFGKLNPLHSDQWLYVDQPLVIRKVFGEHNFTGDGGSIILSPYLGFLLSVELGAWRNFTGPYKDLFLSQRLFSAFGVGNLEVEIGLSSTQGNFPATPKKISSISGADLTLKYITESGRLEIIGEPLFELSDGMNYKGLYLSGFYTSPLRSFQAGLRLDLVDETFGISPVFSYLITETTKIRFQYSLYSQHEHTTHIVFIQFLFGIGPHAHVLQF